jgi:hypothetical protein
MCVCISVQFEASLCSLLGFVEEHGFTVHNYARVPYLSQGDFSKPYYVLSDAILVLSKTPPVRVTPPLAYIYTAGCFFCCRCADQN